MIEIKIKFKKEKKIKNIFHKKMNKINLFIKILNIIGKE
jgi:hypothetical protein